MNHLEHIAAHLDGLDAMLLTSEANCYYATGFMGEGIALVTRRGSWYFTDSRYTEAADKAIGNAAVIREVSREKPFSVLINEALAEAGAEKAGFEDQRMTVAEHAVYSEKLHCTLTPASSLMTELRGSKDEEELSCMTAAQRIAEGALEQILKEIRPGMTEKEIAARLNYLMVSAGAEKTSFDTIVASGPNGSMPHAVPGMRKVREGDFITMDFGCVYKGYCSDMTRTVALGRPSDEMRNVYDIVLQAQLAGIAAAKAGVTGAAIDGAARKVIQDAGYGAYFGHSFGHSLGIDIHEAPNAAPGNDKPMPDGAVISAEPGIYLPGKFGVRIEDVMILRPDGAQVITKAPKALLVL
ncbi:MAG: M24 family metallopeptidase [Vescimonas sp.]